MVDLAQALSEIKSLPDIALRHALSKPDGTIPGFLALSELHERKRVRASAGEHAPTERPSMAQEYMGMDSARMGFASGGPIPKGLQPEGLVNRSVMYETAAHDPRSMYNQAGKGGIVDLLMPGMPAPPVGLGSLEAQMPGVPGASKEPLGFSEGGIVGLAKGGHVSAVDPRLWDITHRAAQGFPYQVQFVSGFRPGDPRFHGEHRALDVQLVDPKTGQALENYQSGDTYGPYWEYAQRVRQQQQELYPDMNVRWGGFNKGEDDKRTYGAADWMHYDTGNVPQRGGSWETGIDPAHARHYGVDPRYVGQGVGQQIATQNAGGYDWANIQNSIANIESAGSGGYSALGPETNGDRPYGRYQIMGNNIGPWTEQHLGTRMTADQFLANQQAQDAVFQGQFGQYINKYGLQGAAQAWLGGPGSVGKTGATDILGTSVGEYGQRFMAGLNQAAPAATGAAAGAAVASNVGDAANAGLQSAGDGGMGDMMMLMQLFGGGQKAPAPAMGGGAMQSPEVPVDPRLLYRQTVPVSRTIPVRRFA